MLACLFIYCLSRQRWLGRGRPSACIRLRFRFWGGRHGGDPAIDRLSLIGRDRLQIRFSRFSRTMHKGGRKLCHAQTTETRRLLRIDRSHGIRFALLSRARCTAVQTMTRGYTRKECRSARDSPVVNAAAVIPRWTHMPLLSIAASRRLTVSCHLHMHRLVSASLS